MNDDELIKIMLTKRKVKSFEKKGEKYITYGEITFIYDILVAKKEKVHVFLKGQKIAIIE